jgi:hypothetical protein
MKLGESSHDRIYGGLNASLISRNRRVHRWSSCQFSVASSQLPVLSCQLPVVSCQFSVKKTRKKGFAYK